MMQIEVNGQPKQLPRGATLEQLVAELVPTSNRLAVELNLNVIPRSQYPALQLQEGDRIEIVHAIGGG